MHAGTEHPSFQTTSVPTRFRPFDRLATLIAVVREDGFVVFANSALEDALGVSRRTIEASPFADNFSEPAEFEQALHGASGNAFAALRCDTWRAGRTMTPGLFT